MARTRFLELPEDVARAVESAASAQGKTVEEWLTGVLPLDAPAEDARGLTSEQESEDLVAQRDLWLMQL
jgi:hypothetical protein